MPTRTCIMLALVTSSLAACGSGARHPAAAAVSTSTSTSLPTGHELAIRVAGAFRSGLRDLSIRTGVGGETEDIGQPIPTAVLAGVACSGSRCVVHWRDLDGRRQRTRYVIGPDTSSCPSGSADPPLGSIRDVTAGGLAEHPLQRLLLGSQPC